MQRPMGLWARSFVFLGLCVLLAITARSPVSTNAQSDAAAARREPADASPSPVRPSAAEMESVIRDIQRIRREVGNSPLQGSSLDTVQLPELRAGESLDEFGTQLRRELVPEANPASRPAPSGAASPHNLVPSNPEALEYYRRSLRSLGRRLDAVAQDLDELSLLEDADRIRDSSRQLRRRLQDEASDPLRGPDRSSR